MTQSTDRGATSGVPNNNFFRKSDSSLTVNREKIIFWHLSVANPSRSRPNSSTSIVFPSREQNRIGFGSTPNKKAGVAPAFPSRRLPLVVKARRRDGKAGRGRPQR